MLFLAKKATPAKYAGARTISTTNESVTLQREAVRKAAGRAAVQASADKAADTELAAADKAVPASADKAVPVAANIPHREPLLSPVACSKSHRSGSGQARQAI